MSDRRLITATLAFLLGASLTALAAQTPSPTAQTTSPQPLHRPCQLSAEDSKLTPHVGHSVEITGTLVSPNASASSSAASAPGLAPAPTLKVENVKMLADRCTP